MASPDGSPFDGATRRWFADRGFRLNAAAPDEPRLLNFLPIHRDVPLRVEP